MAEHTITLTEEQEKAGVAILGSTEAVTAELNRICDYTANPWIKKYNDDVAAQTSAEAVTMKEKYDALKAADVSKAEQVDALLNSAVGAPPQEEPPEG